jgi:hypothetical protein
MRSTAVFRQPLALLVVFACSILCANAGIIYLNDDHRGADTYIIDTGAVPLDEKIPVIFVHGINLDGVPAPTILDGWSNFIQFFNNDPQLSTRFKYYQFALQEQCRAH